jgi:hypothetical protein
MAQQVAESVISNSRKALIATLAHAKEKQLAEAKTAAAGAMSSVSKIPFVGPALAPIAGAAVFAAAMAFEKGGIVPGIGGVDTVPAMLTPGEGIVPKGVMEGLSDMARNGNAGGAPHYHVNMRNTYHVNTIDGDGMQGTLEKHSDQLQRHVEKAIRRLNK